MKKQTKKTIKQTKIIDCYLTIIDKKTGAVIHRFQCESKKHAKHIGDMMWAILNHKFNINDYSFSVADKQPAKPVAVNVEEKIATLEATVLKLMQEIKLNNQLRGQSVSNQTYGVAVN